MLTTPILERFVEFGADDDELNLNGRGWTGRLLLGDDDTRWVIPVADGRLGPPVSGSANAGADDVTMVGTSDLWKAILAPVPPPAMNHLWAASWLRVRDRDRDRCPLSGGPPRGRAASPRCQQERPDADAPPGGAPTRSA